MNIKKRMPRYLFTVSKFTFNIGKFQFHCIDSVYGSGYFEPLPVNEWFPLNKGTID